MLHRAIRTTVKYNKSYFEPACSSQAAAAAAASRRRHNHVREVVHDARQLARDILQHAVHDLGLDPVRVRARRRDDDARCVGDCDGSTCGGGTTRAHQFTTSACRMPVSASEASTSSRYRAVARRPASMRVTSLNVSAPR